MTTQPDNNIVPLFLLEPRFRVYRHLLIQIIILVISSDMLFDTPTKLDFSAHRFFAWMGYVLFLNLIIYGNGYVLAPRFLVKNKLLHYILFSGILILVAMGLITVLQAFIPSESIAQPKSNGVVSFFGISSSVLTIIWVMIGASTLLLFKHWMEHSQRAKALETATLSSELKLLKSQINPHFLFNMLNNANIMIDENPNIASNILRKLNDLLSYQIKDSTQDKVFLEADILFLTDFLDLEKTRRDDFEYTISTEGKLDDTQIPPLLFIPFVENAVKHSADSESKSYVHISFEIKIDELFFMCKNSKPRKNIIKEEGGLGLVNIKRRLELLYENNYSLELKDTETDYSVYLSLKI